MGARAVANDARRVGLAAVRQSRLARAANGQAMEALEPLHDELAMSPVGSVLVLGPLHLLAAGPATCELTLHWFEAHMLLTPPGGHSACRCC